MVTAIEATLNRVAGRASLPIGGLRRLARPRHIRPITHDQQLAVVADARAARFRTGQLSQTRERAQINAVPRVPNRPSAGRAPSS